MYYGDCVSCILGDEFEQLIQKFRSKTFLIRCIFVYICLTMIVYEGFSKWWAIRKCNVKLCMFCLKCHIVQTRRLEYDFCNTY